MKKFIKLITLAAGFLILGACANPKHNVELSNSFWQGAQKNTVTIARSTPPKPVVYQVGSQGLLDIAINSAMAKPINQHLERIDISWYPSLQQAFANKLRQRKIAATVASQPINLENLQRINKDINQYSEVNYSSVLSQHTLGNTLLILKLNALGAMRSYTGFIPTGAPEAYCELTGELINIEDHRLLWRHTATINTPVQGAWDQPPQFPNLTAALRLAVATAQEEVIEDFFSGH